MAVDAVLRAAMKGFNDEEKKIGAIIRVDQPRDSQDQDIAYISLDAVVERRSVDLKRQQAQVDSTLAAAGQEQQMWV